jgi:ectoine hydroxylase-related dioxygenase (phytanoyl-CoA dioxygenase family)
VSQFAAMAAYSSSPAPDDYFEPAAYLSVNRDVAAAGVNALAHWIEYGRDEEWAGHRPNWKAPQFDSRYYLRVYLDVGELIAARKFSSAAEHWFCAGMREVAEGARSLPSDFDEARYLKEHPEVVAAILGGRFQSAFDHWLRVGRDDERAARSLPHHPASGTNRKGYVPAEKAEFWRRNGYLVLEKVIPAEICERVNKRINDLWVGRKLDQSEITIDIFLEQAESRRVKLRSAPAEARFQPYKINDLFMLDPLVKDLALDESVCDALRWVLADDPTAISSLNFERGSTQRFHTDTLYMPGLNEGGMTAAWFALEKATTDAGPLLYYPGSHEIPIYKFTNGMSYQVDGEMQGYIDYMDAAIEERRLVPEEFLPEQGDVLIWHERLYHGGKAINDVAQTRKSLVVHYWRARNLPADEIIAHGGGFHLDRAPFRGED